MAPLLANSFTFGRADVRGFEVQSWNERRQPAVSLSRNKQPGFALNGQLHIPANGCAAADIHTRLSTSKSSTITPTMVGLPYMNKNFCG